MQCAQLFQKSLFGGLIRAGVLNRAYTVCLLLNLVTSVFGNKWALNQSEKHN